MTADDIDRVRRSSTNPIRRSSARAQACRTTRDTDVRRCRRARRRPPPVVTAIARRAWCRAAAGHLRRPSARSDAPIARRPPAESPRHRSAIDFTVARRPASKLTSRPGPDGCCRRRRSVSRSVLRRPLQSPRRRPSARQPLRPSRHRCPSRGRPTAPRSTRSPPPTAPQPAPAPRRSPAADQMPH